MADVLFVLHNRVDPAEPALQAAVAEVQSRGRSVEILQRVLPDPVSGVEGDEPLPDEKVAACQLVASFGGDGTFLYAARTAIHHDIPMFGVNLGRLGFLAWTELQDAAAGLAAWADGETQTETRATLVVELENNRRIAINEAAILKDPAANVIQLEISVDGVMAGRFHADGTVAATPTGSTAYAASAGGPILDPRVDAMVVVPLNPHTLATRALVLPPRPPVEIHVDETTRLLLDGFGTVRVPPDARIRCSLDGPLMKVVRPPGAADFYTQLREKMRWGEPLVREGRSLRGGAQ